MVVKVFGSLKGACPQRVLACLLELGLDYEFVHVDLDSGEHKQPDFLLRQPFGQVPAIEEGEFKLFDRAITESRAIIRYYAEKYAEKGLKLTGNNLEERALVDQWLEVEAHNFNDMLYTLVLQLLVFPKMGGNTDHVLVQNCEKKLEKVLDVYEQRLSESKYLAGDYYSLADLSHLPGIRYLMNEIGMEHLVTDRKSVNSWWIDISNRPAWKKVLQLVAA